MLDSWLLFVTYSSNHAAPKLSPNLQLAFLYVASRQLQLPIFKADIIHLAEDGVIPYFNAIHGISPSITNNFSWDASLYIWKSVRKAY